ncbi:MAG: type II secretion system protein [Pseudomonadota bacterium]|nr:type II secretion system protein [Pseudomonadota bacterium]
MHKMKFNNGFTLIELLVAVAIVGVLVTLALPRYKAQVARSRQGEAKVNLGTIRKLQESYWMYKASIDGTGSYFGGLLGGADKCGAADTKNALGFRMQDCANAFYKYTAVNASNPKHTAITVKAHAEIYPDCAQDDTWGIHQDNGDLDNAPDVVGLCDK